MAVVNGLDAAIDALIKFYNDNSSKVKALSTKLIVFAITVGIDIANKLLDKVVEYLKPFKTSNSELYDTLFKIITTARNSQKIADAAKLALSKPELPAKVPVSGL